MTFMMLLLALTGPTGLQDEYRAHVRFLADDLLEGRETAERGQKLAAAYIAAQLAAAGVQPAYPDSDTPYFQSFELESSGTVPSAVTLTGGGADVTIPYGDAGFDMMSWGHGDPNLSGEIVFLGYGIQSEAYNDYADIDVKDRWIVLLDGEPKLGDKELPERAVGRMGRFMAARGAGVKGIIRLKDEALNVTPGEREMSLPGSDKPGGEGFICLVDIAPDFHEKLFGDAYPALQKAIAAIREKGEPSSFVLPGRTLALKAERESKRVRTENVVGLLPGSDPVLKDEYVVLSAHYDHEGFHGGEVFNGADDNASGTATMLMIGKHLANLPRRRSLILLLLTAEEKGLLGSKYFVQDPLVPLSQIVADVNVDMIGRGQEGQIGIVPSKVEGITTLSELAVRVNADGEHGVAFREDLDRYHHRSDHYNFTREGIPSIFFFTGVHEDYHRPTDDWDKLDYDNMARFFSFFQDFTMNVLNGTRKPAFVKVEE